MGEVGRCDGGDEGSEGVVVGGMIIEVSGGSWLVWSGGRWRRMSRRKRVDMG